MAGRVEDACGRGPEDGSSPGAEEEREEATELMEAQGMCNSMPTEEGAPGPRPMQEVGVRDPKLTNSKLVEIRKGMEERVQFLRLMDAVRVQDKMLTGAAGGGTMDIGGDFSFDFARGRVPGVVYGSGHREERSTHRKTEDVRWDELAEALQAGKGVGLKWQAMQGVQEGLRRGWSAVEVKDMGEVGSFDFAAGGPGTWSPGWLRPP